MNLRRFVEQLFRRNAAPEPADLNKKDPALITLISIVYSTAPKTFTGDAVYVTMSSAAATGTGLSLTKSSDDDDDSSPTTSTSSKSSARATSSSSSATSSSPSTTKAPTTTSTASTSNNVPVAATVTPSATAAASSGMSAGAKGGLAFGLILLFALLGFLIFFFIKKRRRDQAEHHRLDDEKSFLELGRDPQSLGPTTVASTPGSAAPRGAFGAGFAEKAMPPAPAAAAAADNGRRRFSYEEEAPRLSLRAVSQFEPSILSQPTTNPTTAPSVSSNNTAPVAAAAAAGAAGAAAVAGGSKGSLANDPNNPFGNHAEKLSGSPPHDVPLPPSPTSSMGRVSPGPQAADFPMPESGPVTPGKPSPVLTKAEVGTGAAVGAAAIAAATAAAASNKPLVSAASSPGVSATENVHRVQLDFTPSMDDELEIRAGQLVRVLHEYDDGWALCIRMDRSRQGVVPRTCLSKHSVKPRPQSPTRPGARGPPPGVRPGGPPPFAQSPRPLSPSGGRKSPNAPPYAQSPRPLTPTGGRNRSNSSAAPYAAYNPANGAQANGGSPLAANPRRRSNSVNNIVHVKKDSQSKIPAPVGQIPTRKPVPKQS